MLSDTEAEDRASKIIHYCCETVISEEFSEDQNMIKKDFKKKWDSLIEEKFTFKRCELIFNDSIHGSIEINSLERAIINTLEFSRLKDIKQLGGKFYVYQGATHTRFEHSIGVCHLAGELIKHLRTQKSDREIAQKSAKISKGAQMCNIADQDPDFISDEDELCVRLAGLCHDLGHGPFSHLFEDVAKRILEPYCTCADKRKIKHERLSKLFFKKILLDNPWVLAKFVLKGLKKEHVEMIEKMITPEDQKLPEDKTFLYQIVANKESGMDVDKWDYFARDFFHIGATNEFDWRRCMLMSRIVEVNPKDDKSQCTYQIGYRDKEVANIYAMFRTRSVLYVKALNHKTVNAVEKMIADVFYFAKSMTYDGEKTLITALKGAYLKEKSDLSGYMALTDYFFHLIRYSGQDSVKKAKELIDRLRKRDLYKMVDEEIIKDDDIMKEETPEEKLDKMKKVIYKYRDSSNESIRELGSIELCCYKFTSEKSLNPVEKIYFHKKIFNEGKFPRGERAAGVKDAPPLCKPEKLFECRIRLYQHKTLKDEEESRLKKAFKKCHADIKKELEESNNTM